MKDYLSWGRYFRYDHEVRRLFWPTDDLSFLKMSGKTVLAHAYGRSYGDVCLNDQGILLDTTGLNRFKSFDVDRGVLSCECGVSLADILDLAVPFGWFLPVTPGTKFVSVGGAIANDVHGKNHHVAGTFGGHVLRFELVRSDGKRYVCSKTENAELFKATIGGMGLTGFITWAEIQLKPVHSPMISWENIKFGNIDEFFTLSKESDAAFDYTVAWIDCLATGKGFGRGIFMRGNHCAGSSMSADRAVTSVKKPKIWIPFDAPGWLLNSLSMRAFNTLYYHKQRQHTLSKETHYDPFFYPLDAVGDWNKLYGKRGFFQYQFVIPEENAGELSNILHLIAESGHGSSLAVLKNFGHKDSPGMMSFPKPGVTLALDFTNHGHTLDFLRSLDERIIDLGGRFNPSKDSTMEPSTFQKCFPQWKEFAKYIDPRFSSSFWRRVTDHAK